MTGIVCAALMFSLATVSIAPAEAPLKTLALPSGETIAYVEVRDEPRHRHKFENDRVRLYDVLIPPGDTTLYHRHSQNTVYVVIQPSRFRSQMAGGPPIETDLPPGGAFYDTQATKPIIHQVSNIGGKAARLIGVELYKTDKTISRPAIEAPGLKVFQSIPKLRIYQVTLEPGQTTGAVESGFPSMMIALTAGTLSSRPLEPGDYVWSDGPESRNLTNQGDTTFQAVLYELP